MCKKIQLIFFILILALVGCRSNTGVDKSERAVQGMRARASTLENAPNRIDAVTNALDELIKEGGDMRIEFRTFERSIDNLMSDRKQLRNLTGRVDYSKYAFIEAWEERQLTIRNDEIRIRSRKRHTEVVAKFDEVNRLAAKANVEFDFWLQRVLDIRTFLESDLNPSGVAAIADVAGGISDDAIFIKRRVTTLLTELNAVSDAMAVPR